MYCHFVSRSCEKAYYNHRSTSVHGSIWFPNHFGKPDNETPNRIEWSRKKAVIVNTIITGRSLLIRCRNFSLLKKHAVLAVVCGWCSLIKWNILFGFDTRIDDSALRVLVSRVAPWRLHPPDVHVPLCQTHCPQLQHISTIRPTDRFRTFYK
jgi:hypothetical protein